MQLHTIVGSPNGHKVAAVISHLGLDVLVEPHSPVGGDLGGPAYRALNPNGMVPLLVDGAFKLWESNAIMQYLADSAGDTGLFPREPRQRADIARWQCWELAHFNKAMATVVFETLVRAKLNMGEANAALVESARGSLARFAPVLDQHMADRRYIVGDGITLADYSVIAFEAYRPAMPVDWTPYRHLNAYFDRMHDSENWARTAVGPAATAGRGAKAA